IYCFSYGLGYFLSVFLKTKCRIKKKGESIIKKKSNIKVESKNKEKIIYQRENHLSKREWKK
ncbi:MAG: hypothetical protein LBF22_09460, partial [Deltaproteobacteria bacterium]|nr:hypothetical protein [Deltaproteobacteria bacterium]